VIQNVVSSSAVPLRRMKVLEFVSDQSEQSPRTASDVCKKQNKCRLCCTKLQVVTSNILEFGDEKKLSDGRYSGFMPSLRNALEFFVIYITNKPA
jgi:hypothetical protein